MALRHGRVEARDHHIQVGNTKQRPRLVSVEQRAFDALVDLSEERGEVPPLRPVGWRWFHVVGLAVGEVRPACGMVHVVAAGDEHEPVGFQAQQRSQAGEEGQRLLELPPMTGEGDVTGDDEQVRWGRSGIDELRDIRPDPCLDLVTGGASPVRASAGYPGGGQLQNGDGIPRRAGAHGRRVPGRADGHPAGGDAAQRDRWADFGGRGLHGRDGVLSDGQRVAGTHVRLRASGERVGNLP